MKTRDSVIKHDLLGPSAQGYYLWLSYYRVERALEYPLNFFDSGGLSRMNLSARHAA